MPCEPHVIVKEKEHSIPESSFVSFVQAGSKVEIPSDASAFPDLKSRQVLRRWQTHAPVPELPGPRCTSKAVRTESDPKKSSAGLKRCCGCECTYGVKQEFSIKFFKSCQLGHGQRLPSICSQCSVAKLQRTQAPAFIACQRVEQGLQTWRSQ